MKHRWLVCEGLADEPIEDLGGRTPLEVAKTPNLDRLVKEGKIGAASFTPHGLAPGPDVACYSILGFDPEEFYTGPAALEALAIGLSPNDQSLLFRCNLVTVLDDTLVDACAGNISAKESLFLIEDLNKKLSELKIKLVPNHGFKNILLISHSELVDSLNELEQPAPKNLVGQKIDKIFSKNSAGEFLAELIQQSKTVLEGHEINRVRVDLKENPANMIWLWGQGRKPKLPSFTQQYGRNATAVCNADFAKGLTKALNMTEAEDTEEALSHDLIFIYHGLEDSLDRHASLKDRIKLIEDFDAMIVSKVLRQAEKDKDTRICISGDCAYSYSKRMFIHGRVPFLIFGEGIQADETTAFNEKVASQSKWIVDRGEELMGVFLK